MKKIQRTRKAAAILSGKGILSYNHLNTETQITIKCYSVHLPAVSICKWNIMEYLLPCITQDCDWLIRGKAEFGQRIFIRLDGPNIRQWSDLGENSQFY